MSSRGSQAENAKLKKINAALMSRVERAMDQPNNAFGLFEVAITLDKTVRRRTAELQAALRSVERANEALLKAKHAGREGQRVQIDLPRLRQPRSPATAERGAAQPVRRWRRWHSIETKLRRFARQIDLAL